MHEAGVVMQLLLESGGSFVQPAPIYNRLTWRKELDEI